VNPLYLKVAAALEKHGVTSALKADVDSIFAGTDSPPSSVVPPVVEAVPAAGAATPAADLSPVAGMPAGGSVGSAP